MALVTVQRSPCGDNTNSNCHSPSTDEIDGSSGKTNDEKATEKKGTRECYFAVKGAALVLPHDECLHVHRKTIANGACDIQQHLQSMLYLLHDDDILKMAVKLESIHSSRTRYLVVVSHTGKLKTEESCLLGIDCNKETTIGLVLPIWADTRITLDGDGGFSVTSSGRHHIFKPVSVQAMWSALQTLHKASSKAREYNYFKSGGTHQWIDYYESHISSDRSCLNEWHAMDDIESRRPPSPDTVRLQPTEREETERHIRTKLKELMMSVDLDDVTSKYIRTRLEEILDMDLKEYKSFIDQEMLTILGQMDAPTEIFQYLYLGSEWNASNLEELVVNGIGHILNVTREIDNFFPGMFDYQNIRVYDDESTEILHYWDKTYRYIRRAKDEGSKVLVHCKMGISRSASVVIAYVMKAYDWNLDRALEFVKTKRGCIKPNSGFLKQLEIYQGILDASKQRHNSLWRSKSETNLKSSPKPKKKSDDKLKQKMPEKCESFHHLRVCNINPRPKSWSPNDALADMLFPPENYSYDEEQRIAEGKQRLASESLQSSVSTNELSLSRLKKENSKSTDVLNIDVPLPRVSSIKDRINELELQVSSTSDKLAKSEVKSPTSQGRSGIVFNLANQFESSSKPSSPIDEGLIMKLPSEEIVEPIMSQTKPPVHKHHAILVKPSLWPEDNSSDVENKAPVFPNSNSAPVNKTKTSSESSCLHKKVQSDEKSCDNSPASVFLGENSPCSCKTSQSMNSSAFKPFDASANLPAKLPLDKKLNSYQQTNLNNNNNNERKLSQNLPSTSSLERNIRHSSTNLKEANKIPPKGLSKNSETLIPIIKPSIKACLGNSQTDILNSKVNYFYDKEDIPFTPGKVMRTKQKIEEKNLTRTTSFDSGFPFQIYSTPSTPSELDISTGSIRRSHSLRNDNRTSIPFYGKWYPLPALASVIPPVTTDLHCVDNTTMIHSVSTPSVVEAVNRVICGTQEVLNSAIHFMPSEKKVSSIHSSSDSDFEFGSASSLPDIESRDLAFIAKSSGVQSESPVPGLVRQQCELLENKATRTLSEKCGSDQCKSRRDALKLLSSDQGSSLVASDASKQDVKEHSIVKRLKKELEAKSNSDTNKKEKNAVSISEISSESNALPSLERQASHLNSELNTDLHMTRLRSSLSSSQAILEETKAPPTPHRKTSLDLSFLHRFPLSIKLGTQPTVPPIKLNSRTSDSKTFETSASECKKPLLQQSAKVSPCVSEIPPPLPPPTGLPRKIRKQQGSTHPLSKLIRQRHPNPLYNTM